MATSKKQLNTDEDLSPHQMIAMLLEGALTRIDEAVACIEEKDIDAAAQRVIKTIRIVEGLQESLNLEIKGDIAPALNNLYRYIGERLRLITTETPLETLEEVKGLLCKVQDAWSAIENQADYVMVNAQKSEQASHATA